MSIYEFEVFAFFVLAAIVTTMVVFYNVWIKRDAKRRIKEMAEPEKFIRR